MQSRHRSLKGETQLPGSDPAVALLSGGKGSPGASCSSTPLKFSPKLQLPKLVASCMLQQLSVFDGGRG